MPVCARLNFDIFSESDPPTFAHLGVPACDLGGEVGAGKVVNSVLRKYRPKGALYSWMGLQGVGDAYVGQEVLSIPILDAAVRARYPADGDPRKGPIKLKPIDVASGWVADNTTWKSGLTSIVPAKQFRGDLGNSSWLQNEDLAFIYRAYATYDKPLSITSPASGMPASAVDVSVGSDVPIRVDVSKFPNWKKLTFYDGAKKLGEITQGKPTFTAKNLTPGYHVYSVLGTDAQGNLRTSNPAMVIAPSP